jgi:two-component system, cell cycle sensor histidine kinase and response regulator CckA
VDERSRVLVGRAAVAPHEPTPSFESTLSAAPVGAAVFDAALQLTWANATLLQMAGATEVRPGAPTAETLRDASRGIEALVARVRDARQAAVGVDVAVPNAANGERRVWCATAYPIAGGSGALAGIGLIAADVTAHREAERALQQSQMLAAIGTMAANLAHDLNNQLTAVRSYVFFAAKALPEDHPARKDIAEIELAAERAAELTRRVLASRRVIGPLRGSTDLNAIASEVATAVAQRFEAPIATTLALDSELVAAAIAPADASRALTNLVTNACEAMPNGGLLTIQTANVDEGPVEGAHPMVEVRDTGIGMSSQVLAHLFEPLFTTKPRGMTAGLGLSTVDAIVRHAGGDVRVTSEPGRGTSVAVHLRAAVERRVREARKEVGVSVRDKTVLVVDDDPTIRELVRRVLVGMGCRVLIAPDGASALDIERTHDGVIDLVLTDLTMPGMTGIELARQFAARRPDAKVMLMTGYGDEFEDGLRLDKPFTPTILTATLEKLFAD